MGQAIVPCPHCGAEVLVQQPGQKVGAAYFSFAYRDAEAAERFQQGLELVAVAAADLPWRPELAEVTGLLRQADSQLIVAPERSLSGLGPLDDLT